MDACTSICGAALTELQDPQSDRTESAAFDASDAVVVGAASMLNGWPDAWRRELSSDVEAPLSAAWELFDQHVQQSLSWLRSASIPQGDAAPFGATLRCLSMEMCNIFFLYAPLSERSPLSCAALKECLSHLAPLYKAASTCAWSADGRGSDRWEDVVSQLAALAFHALLVQTAYGANMFQRSVAARCLGVQEACQFLQQQLQFCAQPEHFLEGLIVLQLCAGVSTLAMIAPWLQTFNRDRRVKPRCLEASCDAAAAGRATPSSTSLRAILHFDTVLLMYAIASQVALSVPRKIASTARSAAASSSAARAPIPASSAPSLQFVPPADKAGVGSARALLVGMLSREQLLQAQKHNLYRFVQENQDEFDRMPYTPWTVAPRNFRPVRTLVSASFLPGLCGVFLQEDVPRRTNSQLLLLYPGLLMTDTLFHLFVSQYNCPTALELPALSWKTPQGEHHKMLIIGDPTSPGAIVNDGKKSNKAGTCAELIRTQ